MSTHSKVDVLIVGAGPAGLLLATQLSKLKVNVRIIDKQAHPVLRGHADGLQCRTVEVFNALGVGQRFRNEGHECAEVVMWNKDTETGEMVESNRVADTQPGLSHVRHILLGQNKVEDILIDAMKEYNDLEVERLMSPRTLEVDESRLGDDSAYPITVTVDKLPPPKEWANGDVKSGLYRSNLFANDQEEQLTNGDRESEVIKCKYVVGCDGARSWVRKQLELELEGDSANVYWGAFDAVLKTDLPSVRMKNVFYSAEYGSVMTIPREKGLSRVYTQMGTLAKGQRVNRAEVTLEKLLERTQNAMKPFNVEFPYVDWYTCYEIGQRHCKTFSKFDNRIFIAGDACHTHSPKAGQGMNVSMMDSWNLGWKLSAVLKGHAKRELLATYNAERQAIAKELIDFDYEWSRMFSSAQTKADGVKPEVFKANWEKSIKFTSGTGVTYKSGPLVQSGSDNTLATNIIVGSHLRNQQVVGVSNAHTIQLQDMLVADGRWRILLFPGDVSKPDVKASLFKIADYLDSTDGPIHSYTPKNQEIDSLIQVLTVVKTPHKEAQQVFGGHPSILAPARQSYGVRATDTIFTDEPSYHDGEGKAYQGYGINPNFGCIVLVRPDHYVAGVYDMTQYEAIETFLSNILVKKAKL